MSHVNRLTIDEAEQILVRHGKTLDTLFIVVDAVNESPHRGELMACLVRLASQLENLRIIVSSTGAPDFDLTSQPFHAFEVQMEPGVVNGDIQLYLQNALDKKGSFSHGLRLEIKESILRESRGM
jgi:hypothetical protein